MNILVNTVLKSTSQLKSLNYMEISGRTRMQPPLTHDTSTSSLVSSRKFCYFLIPVVILRSFCLVFFCSRIAQWRVQSLLAVEVHNH